MQPLLWMIFVRKKWKQTLLFNLINIILQNTYHWQCHYRTFQCNDIARRRSAGPTALRAQRVIVRILRRENIIPSIDIHRLIIIAASIYLANCRAHNCEHNWGCSTKRLAGEAGGIHKHTYIDLFTFIKLNYPCKLLNGHLNSNHRLKS